MSRRVLLALCATACAACTASSKGDGGIVGGGDAGPEGTTGAYAVTPLAVPLNGVGDLLEAGVSSDNRIGIAFISETGDPDMPAEVDYTEISAAGVQGPVVAVDRVTNVFGVSVAFDPQTGEPWVAYLAHDPNAPAYTPGVGGYPATGAIAWHENALGVAIIDSSGNVSRSYAAHTSADADAGDSFSDMGDVVGLWPAIAFDPENGDAVVAYRDVHFGQNPQDYSKSDLKVARGRPGSWRGEVVIDGTTNDMWIEPGVGALNKIALAPGLGLGVISSGEPDVVTTPGGVYFALEAPGGGGWAYGSPETPERVVPIAANPGITGASLAGDPQVGFGVAWVDMNTNILSYESLTAVGMVFGGAQSVFGSGTGGWYPSLAFDANHAPNIAFYVCAAEPGVSGAQCPADQQALMLARQVGTGPETMWSAEVVDPSGGFDPSVLLVDSKLVVVYRDLGQGGLKLATPTAQ